ncbi:hypothetical protein VBG69_08655 [Carnobacterium maltaromaticum]|uniref:hypothetical protein n=1 Tax=Carnobacterium maltaromaticum TaxID=2751 RepID=UPI003796EC30
MKKQKNQKQILIKQNNELRENLTKENKVFYEDLLVYMRTAGFLYDDLEIESSLMQILQDIMLAQKDGESAENYFGKNPKEIVDEMIQSMDKISIKAFIKLFGLLFGISSFFPLLDQLTNSENKINFLVILLNGLISLFAVVTVVYILHKSIYLKTPKKKSKPFLLIWLLCCFIIGAYILVNIFTPSVFLLTIPDVVIIIIIIILVLGITTKAVLSAKKDQLFWWALTPYLWFMGGIALALRFKETKPFMLSQSGGILILVLNVIGLILYLGFMYLDTKREKQKPK